MNSARQVLLPAAMACAMALLVGCFGAMRQAPSVPTSAPTVSAADVAGAVYAVSAADSEVHVLVFRGGVLARLGHDHVVTSRSLAGRVWVHPEFARSGFELSFPVSELIVDEPESRAAAGVEFGKELSQADRDGTRRNMLGSAVLDAQHYPNVRLASLGLSGSMSMPVARTRIAIKDVSRSVEVPVMLAIDGSSLTATGEFDILQSDFGIEPFSVALGALTVQDRLRIRFKVVARNEGA